MTGYELMILFLATSWQESSFNAMAVNKKENAKGIVQIRPCVLQDLWKFKELDFWSDDRYSVNKSFRMYKEYTELWLKRRKLKDTPYNRARIWNGGAINYKTKAAKKYAQKVCEKMDIIHNIITTYEIIKKGAK